MISPSLPSSGYFCDHPCYPVGIFVAIPAIQWCCVLPICAACLSPLCCAVWCTTIKGAILSLSSRLAGARRPHRGSWGGWQGTDPNSNPHCIPDCTLALSPERRKPRPGVKDSRANLSTSMHLEEACHFILQLMKCVLRIKRHLSSSRYRLLCMPPLRCVLHALMLPIYLKGCMLEYDVLPHMMTSCTVCNTG